jgi:hypothetical protein
VPDIVAPTKFIQEENMNGRELIAWAVKQCELAKVPPHDGNILVVIRQWQPTTGVVDSRTEADKEIQRYER